MLHVVGDRVFNRTLSA